MKTTKIRTIGLNQNPRGLHIQAQGEAKRNPVKHVKIKTEGLKAGTFKIGLNQNPRGLHIQAQGEAKRNPVKMKNLKRRAESPIHLN